jgi:hypothetical protein
MHETIKDIKLPSPPAIALRILEAVKKGYASFVIATELNGNKQEGFDFIYFWKRAVTCAVGAELSASLLHYKNDDLCFGLAPGYRGVGFASVSAKRVSADIRRKDGNRGLGLWE